MKFYWEILKALPAIVKMLEAYQKAKADAEAENAIKSKVADDVKEIHNAFESKDAEKLRALFNSK